MTEVVLSLMRNLFNYNLKRAFRLNRKNRYLQTLYLKSREAVNNKSKYFIYLKRLYDFNQQRSIYLYKNHRYLKILMDECEKECKKKEEATKEEKTEVNLSNNEKKAALLIGITYKGTNKELYGCENDVFACKKILIDQFKFKEENIKILTESSNDSSLTPTYNNIIDAFKWLVQKSDEGYGSLWFQYSGHGYYFRDRDGDEKDRYDECLVTSDNYAVMDDEIRNLLVNRLRSDCKLFCLMDCCHSGTILDLEYKYRPSTNSMAVENKFKTKANVWALSGCKDYQESADAEFSRNEWAGALTKNFLDILKRYNYSPKLNILLKDLHKILREQGFSQIPELTCSKQLSTNVTFSL